MAACARCGVTIADEAGRYGCPNCHGEGLKNPAAVALGRLGGRKGGKSKSEAKAAAARANGAKGGRPKKVR